MLVDGNEQYFNLQHGQTCAIVSTQVTCERDHFSLCVIQ